MLTFLAGVVFLILLVITVKIILASFFVIADARTFDGMFKTLLICIILAGFMIFIAKKTYDYVNKYDDNNIVGKEIKIINGNDTIFLMVTKNDDGNFKAEIKK